MVLFFQQSVGDLLDCSMGSDDVFDSDPLPGLMTRPKTPSSNGSIVGKKSLYHHIISIATLGQN